MAERKTVKKLSSTSTKQEMLDAYNDLLSQMEEKREAEAAPHVATEPFWVGEGTAYQINMVQTAAPIDWSDVLGVQWQIDTNANGGAVHEWVDKSTVTIW